MHTLRIRFSLILLGLMIFALGFAAAQDTPFALQSSAGSDDRWQVNRSDASDLLVVTRAKPTVRQHCTVQEISADELLC